MLFISTRLCRYKRTLFKPKNYRYGLEWQRIWTGVYRHRPCSRLLPSRGAYRSFTSYSFCYSIEKFDTIKIFCPSQLSSINSGWFGHKFLSQRQHRWLPSGLQGKKHWLSHCLFSTFFFLDRICRWCSQRQRFIRKSKQKINSFFSS